MDLSPLGFKKGLVLLCLLGLIVRIGFLVEHARTPSFGVPTLDQKYYDTVAKMLVAGEDLHALHGFRPLLYPMFLAVWYKLGGSWGIDLALLAQHLLGVATGLLVALLGARLFRHRLSGLLAGVLFLLAPVPLCFEGELLIEPSYTFLICLGLLVILRAAEGRGWKSGWLWVLSGALTVLTSQARANILVFMAVYPAFAIWQWWHSRGRTALVPLLGLAGGLAMAIPWGFINLTQSEHFHLLPNAGGVNFYLGNKRDANGMLVGQDVITSLSKLSLAGTNAIDDSAPGQTRTLFNDRYQDLVEVWAREEYEAAMRGQGRNPESDPMAISRYWTGRTFDEIRAAPGAWMQLMVKKCWIMLWNVEVPNNKDFAFLQEEFVWLRILPVRWIVLLILAPAGIWAAARWGCRDDLLVLLLYCGLYSAGNVAFFICDRYRYPVWPAMAAIGGGGFFAIIETVRRRSWRRFALLLGGMASLAVLSLPNWFGAKLPNFAHDFQFRSIAWYEKGHYREALCDIDKSLGLDALDPSAHLHRGNVLFALGQLEEARMEYERTLRFIPGNAGAWNNLGATLDALGRPNEAMEAFRRATECRLPGQNAFLGMALLQLRSGQLEEAAKTLDQLTRLERRPDAVALAIGSVLERRRGNTPRANVLEQQARRLDPNAAAWAIERAGATGLP